MKKAASRERLCPFLSTGEFMLSSVKAPAHIENRLRATGFFALAYAVVHVPLEIAISLPTVGMNTTVWSTWTSPEAQRSLSNVLFLLGPIWIAHAVAIALLPRDFTPHTPRNLWLFATITGVCTALATNFIPLLLWEPVSSTGIVQLDWNPVYLLLGAPVVITLILAALWRLTGTFGIQREGINSRAHPKS